MKNLYITAIVVLISFQLSAQFHAGSGTELDPYQVSTPSQLSEVRNYLDSYFIQINDINLSSYDHDGDGKGWLPIGGAGSTDMFTGNYDGQSYVITNLTINRPNTDDIGLFGLIGEEGNTKTISVTNLGLKNVSINGGDGVGSLAGGIISNKDTKIEFCYASNGDVIADGHLGGLIGYVKSYEELASTAEKPVVTKSFSFVNIEWSIINSGDHFGGLIGSTYAAIVTDCYSRSYITIDNSAGTVASLSNIGGLIGSASNKTEITNCYATGSITTLGASSISHVGGLIGSKEGNVTVTDSYWDIETTGQTTSDGGTGKTTAEMKQASTYSSYDFVNTWGIDGDKNDGYPFLIGDKWDVLPVELVSFSAELYDEDVELEWSTASEINNDYFTIERSTNGIDFTVIETINGAGNSSERLSYYYTDSNPKSGINYYRLKQTDFDGKYEYFEMVSIECDTKDNNIDVYPNPSNGIFTVSTNSDNDESYSIYDNSGRVVTNGTLSSFANNIDISDLPKGVYFLKIGDDNDFSNTTRIVSRGVKQYIIPPDDIFVDKPLLSEGSCVVQFDNMTGYYIDVWVDKAYMGRLNPWENTELILPEGYTDVYCRTFDETYQWGSASNFNEQYQLKLETEDIDGTESTESNF